MTEVNSIPFKAVQSRLMLAHDRRNVWSYVVDAGTLVEDLAAPERWMNIASRISTWDRIEVIEESGAYFAEFLVTSADQTGITLRPLKGIELGGQVGTIGAANRAPRDFSVTYRGPVLKWSVMKEGKPLHGGFAKEAEAYQWLHAHVQSVNQGSSK